MSWNGAGVFNRIYSWVADKNAAIDITASRMDTDTDDITSNGFGNTLTRDGQGSATANLPMNTFRHTGAGNGVARTDYAAMGQLEDGLINWAVATGTADAIAASVSPAVTVLADGQLSFFRATASNATTTPTYALSGLTPRTITKDGGVALAVGDIPGALAECALRYNLANTRWELLNPASGVVGPGSATDGHLAVFSGSTGKIIKDGGSFTVASAQLAASAVSIGATMLNGTIVASIASSQLTVKIKTLAGNDPSTSDPVWFIFRDANAALGDYTVIAVTNASTMSVATVATATLGVVTATPARLWLLAYNNSGFVELALINCRSGVSIYPLAADGVITVSGLVNGSNSAQVPYGTGGPNVPYSVLGYLTWEAGNTMTAGTWVSPSSIGLYRPGVNLPGQVIQRQGVQTGAYATGTTTFTPGAGIPQNTAGDQYMSLAVTPVSSANVLYLRSQAVFSTNGAGESGMALFQDSTANALAATAIDNRASGANYSMNIDYELISGTISSTTFKIRIGDAAENSTYFNGAAGAQQFGGVSNSYLKAQEIMA